MRTHMSEASKFVVVVLVCAAGAAAAQKPGLTAEEAARRAVATSLELRGQREQAAAAEASVDQARAGYIPRVSATARYTRLSDIEQTPLELGPMQQLKFPVLLNQTSVSAGLVVPVSDYLLRVSPAIDAARQGLRATEADGAATAARVDTNARVAYYGWVRAKLQVDVAKQAVDQARAHLGDV